MVILLSEEGKKEKAVATVDQFFSSFPHMNFPYDQSRMGLQAIRFYFTLDQEKKAQEHLNILADALVDRMAFYNGLLSAADRTTFQAEMQESLGMIQNAMQIATII